MRNLKSKESKHAEYFKDELLSSGFKKQVLRGAGITVFSQVSIYCVQLIGTVILARLLTPNDFGLVAMVTVFSFLLQNFGTRGFTEATIQSDEIDHKKISTLFWIHVALSIAITMLFITFSPLIAWFYNEPRLVSICIIIALSFVFNALSTQHIALLTRRMQFYRITANEITAALIATSVTIGIAWLGGGYWSLAARRVVPLIAMAAGAWVLCRWCPGMPARETGVKQMLKFGINTYGNFVNNYFSRNIDKMLIGWRYGAKSLGFYERAYYLFVMPVSQLSYPLTNVAVTTLSKLREDSEKCRSYYLNALSVLAFIGVPLSAILTLIGRDFLLLLLGPQWIEAGKIFTVFGPGVGILLIYGTHGWLHLSLGRADKWLRWGILELIISIAAFAIGISYGAIGVAVAYTVSIYVLVGPGLWYAGRPIQITLSSIVSVIWKYYVSALIAGLSCWYMLYSYDFTAKIYIDLNIYFRVIVASVFIITSYLLLIIVFYHNTKPLSQFVSVLHDIFPKP
jgi:PST family polysaccharide transporter